jgi:hypothetical protein
MYASAVKVPATVTAPQTFADVVDDVPITVVFEPRPTADAPMTIEFVFPLAAKSAFEPTQTFSVPVVQMSPLVDPTKVLSTPVVFATPLFLPTNVPRAPVVLTDPA